MRYEVIDLVANEVITSRALAEATDADSLMACVTFVAQGAQRAAAGHEYPFFPLLAQVDELAIRPVKE